MFTFYFLISLVVFTLRPGPLLKVAADSSSKPISNISTSELTNNLTNLELITMNDSYNFPNGKS